jgi:hypothetical protein
VIDKYPRQSPLLIGGIYDSCIDGNGIDHGLLIDGILDIIENKVARWGGGRKPDSVINGAPEHAMFLLHELLLHLMDRKLDIRQEDRSWNEHYERVVKLRDVSPAMSAIAGRIEKSGSVRGVIWWPKADAEGSDVDKKTK